MTTTLIRGRLLSYNRAPTSIDDSAAYSYESDGALLVEGGQILASGAYAAVKADAPEGVAEIDHRPHLIVPGFIDTHLHFPQMQVMASYAANLLEWLNTYTFPEECRFVETAHAERIAKRFFDEMVRHGTTTATAYCSVHKASADAFFAEALRRDMRMVAGKVMMDRNAPQGLLDTPQMGYDETRAVIRDWHGKGRNHVAITPRFAITSTPEQMDVAKSLVHEFPDLHVQTHLSENRDEIAFTCELYPEAKDYTDVYARYGLLGPKSLFGHCIHLSDREADAMSDWQLLIGVRERRRDAARAGMQQEQRVAAACAQQVQQAEADWRAQLAARSAHAQALRDSVSGGGASVEALRQSGAWHGALGARIAARAQALVQAQRRFAQQQAVLAQARRALLKADAELEQACKMQQRRRREQLRIVELRIEDALEETGTQAWDARRREMA